MRSFQALKKKTWTSDAINIPTSVRQKTDLNKKAQGRKKYIQDLCAEFALQK